MVRSSNKSLLVVGLLLFLLSGMLLMSTFDIYNKQRAKYEAYIKNVPFITEKVDKVIFDTKNKNSKQYTAILNAEEVFYDKLLIEKNISVPYITYQKIDEETAKKYNLLNVKKEPYLKMNIELHLPDDYFKNN